VAHTCGTITNWDYGTTSDSTSSITSGIASDTTSGSYWTFPRDEALEPPNNFNSWIDSDNYSLNIPRGVTNAALKAKVMELQNRLREMEFDNNCESFTKNGRRGYRRKDQFKKQRERILNFELKVGKGHDGVQQFKIYHD